MKVRVTFDLSDEERRAIAKHYGMPGKASRERCATWLHGNAMADLSATCYDLDDSDESDDSDRAS